MNANVSINRIVEISNNNIYLFKDSKNHHNTTESLTILSIQKYHLKNAKQNAWKKPMYQILGYCSNLSNSKKYRSIIVCVGLFWVIANSKLFSCTKNNTFRVTNFKNVPKIWKNLPVLLDHTIFHMPIFGNCLCITIYIYGFHQLFENLRLKEFVVSKCSDIALLT